MNDESREPAFPIQTESSDRMNVPNYGLTKREYFAAMAMQGFLANSFYAEVALPPEGDKRNRDDELAQRCVAMADELLKQLSQ